MTKSVFSFETYNKKLVTSAFIAMVVTLFRVNIHFLNTKGKNSKKKVRINVDVVHNHNKG
jgi:hypothetical protein